MNIHKAKIAIIGGGPAGVSAALTASKYTKDVILIEERPILGGVAAGEGVHSILTFHGKKGHKIIGGIPQQIINRLKKAKGAPGHIRDTVGVAFSVTPADTDVLPWVLQEMMEESGAGYILCAKYLKTVTRGKRIKQVHGIHPGGSFSIEADVFIDCTGSGAPAADCGCQYEQGRDGAPMPATLIFNASRVNLKKTLDYVLANKDEFHHETIFDILKTSPAPGVSGFFTLWKKAGLSAPRDRLLFYGSVKPGEVGINSTRITGFDPLDEKSVNMALLEGKRQVMEIYGFLKKSIPGFEDCIISKISPFLGVREVRRIKGRYVLTGEDLAAGRRFDDDVALGGFPIDIHSPKDSNLETDEVGGQGYYGIPYRCLLPLDCDNLLIAGKCFSAQFKAHASARVQGTSMAMGQAVGTAAALAVEHKCSPVEVDTNKLRQRITDLGGILDSPEKEELE